MYTAGPCVRQNQHGLTWGLQERQALAAASKRCSIGLGLSLGAIATKRCGGGSVGSRQPGKHMEETGRDSVGMARGGAAARGTGTQPGGRRHGERGRGRGRGHEGACGG